MQSGIIQTIQDPEFCCIFVPVPKNYCFFLLLTTFPLVAFARPQPDRGIQSAAGSHIFKTNGKVVGLKCILEEQGFSGFKQVRIVCLNCLPELYLVFTHMSQEAK